VPALGKKKLSVEEGGRGRVQRKRAHTSRVSARKRSKRSALPRRGSLRPASGNGKKDTRPRGEKESAGLRGGASNERKGGLGGRKNRLRTRKNSRCSTGRGLASTLRGPERKVRDKTTKTFREERGEESPYKKKMTNSSPSLPE